MKKLLIALSIFTVISGHQIYAGVVSFDQLATSSDLTVAKFNADLNRIYQKVNNSVQTDNIENDTIMKVDMADDADAGLMIYETGGSGSECEMVYTGLLSATTSGTLTGSVPSGTAYVRGYRIAKSSNTPKTWTASKWTYVDLNSSGTILYQEVAIGAAAPAISANSIRLSRVSTDATEVNSVSDMRTTSCTSATFSGTKEVTTEGSLQNMFQYGTQTRKDYIGGDSPEGWAQGLFVSYDTQSNFLVTSGSAYINGKYRYLAANTDIPTSADDPTNGISGIVSGSVVASTAYKVYAVADQDSVGTLSISFGTAATGLTNYREIGQIKTDSGAAFTSADATTAHGISNHEILRGWIQFNGTGTVVIRDSYNVSALADGGAGTYTISWDTDFSAADYACVGAAENTGGNLTVDYSSGGFALASAGIVVFNIDGTATDSPNVSIMATGD